jgi:hypothetical protein
MTVSFRTDIVPLFTTMDVEHMRAAGMSLDDHAFMSQPANAANVYDQVASGAMPPSECGEPPWSAEQLRLFADWIDGGYQP